MYYFKPAAALPLGASYRVGVDAEHLNQAFRVVPALTPDPEPLSTEAWLAPATRTVRGVCCEELSSACGAPYFCAALEVEQGAKLAFDVAFPPSQFGQWRTRVHSWRADGTEIVGVWGAGLTTTFEQRPEYCIQAEISSLVDGSNYLLDRRCLPHGDLPQFGAHVEDPLLHARSISQCAYPRPGVEDAWCAGMAERCAAGVEADACSRREQYCGASGAAADGGTAEDPVARDEGDQNGLDVVRATGPRGGVGCALAHAAEGRRRAWVGACVLALGWMLRRRRGDRCAP